jgi:hypothetical protein
LRLAPLPASSSLFIHPSPVRKHTKSGQFVCNDLLIQFNIPGLPFGGVGTSVECPAIQPKKRKMNCLSELTWVCFNLYP